MMINLQQAIAADAGLIAGIGAKTFLESHGNSAPAADIESYVAVKFDPKAIVEELNDPDNIFHIIYYQAKAVGYSKIIFNTPHPLISSGTVTKLERFYLLEEFHGRKLGLKLIEFIVSLSKDAGQAGMWLYVWTQNLRAISFYKKNGFEIIGNTDFRISATHSNPNHVMYLDYS